MTRWVTDVTRRSWLLLGDHHREARGLKPPFSRPDLVRASWTLLEVANTWHVFMRRYFVVSATGGRLASGGTVTGPTIYGSGSDAIDAAVLFVGGAKAKPSAGWRHRDEPNWMDPTIVSRALGHLSLSNALGFSGAMSAGSGTYEKLYTCRNFVAHRSRGTALKVRRVARSEGVHRNADPAELPYFPAVGRPQSLICDWVDELRTIIELVPQ